MSAPAPLNIPIGAHWSVLWSLKRHGGGSGKDFKSELTELRTQSKVLRPSCDIYNPANMSIEVLRFAEVKGGWLIAKSIRM